ncbi:MULTISPECIES: phage virion morphogenesis protein [Vibrio]|uniref:phage virion morphogenesis protein n=1 Tax=Vibrio TaxID=662 RepID=UPI00148BC8AE|nr:MULTISPECIES: phage virion morphogenesis protein [Vibrio]NOI32189.1 virion morphogenesis protein [Vibrio coralliilyticus]NOI51345.1 virion morphogenesis protein [Vibrio coralliilyticus]USE02723.1 phage virion morphogenesis protein [Vibrio sp. SCSIO 43133]
MSELTLKTPEQLTQVVESLVLTASEKFDLNRRMANRARQFFRAQIRAQRDIDNNPYQSRTRRKKVKIREGLEGAHTANNKNMLLGFGRSMRTIVTEDNFEVGIKGVAGDIGREHNEGSQVSFTTRVNGFFDSKVGRWKGGTLTKRNYTMPKRTFIGWTPALERELLAMAAEYFALEDAA